MWATSRRFARRRAGRAGTLLDTSYACLLVRMEAFVTIYWNWCLLNLHVIQFLKLMVSMYGERSLVVVPSASLVTRHASWAIGMYILSWSKSRGVL